MLKLSVFRWHGRDNFQSNNTRTDVSLQLFGYPLASTPKAVAIANNANLPRRLTSQNETASYTVAMDQVLEGYANKKNLAQFLR